MWAFTWGRSKCHREINRIESSLTSKNVFWGLVTGSKYFHCWNLLFALMWENVLVPEECFSAFVQGTQRPRGESCVLCRPFPSHWYRCGFFGGKYVPTHVMDHILPWALGGLIWNLTQMSIQPWNVPIQPRSLCRYFPVIFPFPSVQQMLKRSSPNNRHSNPPKR